MPVLLDTDHLSNLQGHEQPACERLLSRLDTLAPDDVSTTIVNFQEQIQGWQAYVNRARSDEQIVRAYEKLELLWRWFLKMNVVSFDRDAQERFSALRPRCRRVKTMDLRIACVALTTDSTLLTRNVRDFRQVPGLAVEDWSR